MTSEPSSLRSGDSGSPWRELVARVIALQGDQPPASRRGEILLDQARAATADKSTPTRSLQILLQSIVSYVQERSTSPKRATKRLMVDIARALNSTERGRRRR